MHANKEKEDYEPKEYEMHTNRAPTLSELETEIHRLRDLLDVTPFSEADVIAEELQKLKIIWFKIVPAGTLPFWMQY